MDKTARMKELIPLLDGGGEGVLPGGQGDYE